MLHRIQSEQFLKCSREAAWAFISNPANLAEITPSYMQFKVLRGAEQIMYPGQIIEYTVRPLLNIPLHWVTEITHVKDEESFVDEQRFGPYSFWHHQHTLIDTAGGVKMFDTVHYKLPYGIFGKLADQVAIRHQLAGIFSYRRNKLDTLFNQDK